MNEFTIADQQLDVVAYTGGSTNNAVAAAVSGKRAVLLYGWLSAGATATTYKFEDTDGTALSGTCTLPANTAHELEPPQGIMFLKSATGKGIQVDVGAGDLNGVIVYAYVQAQ